MSQTTKEINRVTGTVISVSLKADHVCSDDLTSL